MKKIVFVLIACLTLIWATNAFADHTDGLGQDLIESIAALYDQYGDFKTWPAEGYQTAASILCEANIISEANLLAVTDQSSDTMGDSLLNLLSGVSSKFIKRVAVSAWGDDDFWTLENAAWYTETLKSHQLYSPSIDKAYMLPSENTPPVEELVKKATEYIKQKYNVDCSDADYYYSYYAPNMYEAPRSKIVFCIQGTQKRMFTFEIDNSEKVLQCSIYQESGDETGFIGYIFVMSLEDQAEYAQQFTVPMYGFPDSSHIQEDQARELARAALEEHYGVHYDSDQLNEYVSFVITGEDPGTYPYWTVSYTDVQKGRIQYYVNLSAVTGETLKVHFEDWTIPGKG